MTAKTKIDPSRLPVPRLPATHSAKTKQKPIIPTYAEILELPAVEQKEDAPPKKKRKPWNKGKKRKRKPTIWTPERDRTLVELYNLGKTDAEIAEEIHLEKEQVERRVYVLRERGPLRGAKPRDKRIWSKEDDARMCEMYLRGVSYREIAEEFGRSISAVQTRCYSMRCLGKLPQRNGYNDPVHK